MTLTLLPQNATPQEKALAATQGRISNIPVGRLAALWDPDECPAELLGVLAWSLGATEWDPDWPEEVRRAALREMPRIHAERGTWAAVDRVLALAEAVAEIEEGPDASAGLEAMQGRIRIHNSDSLTQSVAHVTAAIERAKRMTFHIEILTGRGIRGDIPAGGAVAPISLGGFAIA